MRSVDVTPVNSIRREPAIRPDWTAILASQLRSIRVNVPGFIEVYSVGSMSATKYRGAPDREPSPPGPWQPGPGPTPRTAPGRQSRDLAHNALDLEPGQSSIWAPEPCTLPVRGADLKPLCMMSIGGCLSKQSPFEYCCHILYPSSRICSCCMFFCLVTSHGGVKSTIH